MKFLRRRENVQPDIYKRGNRLFEYLCLQESEKEEKEEEEQTEEKEQEKEQCSTAQQPKPYRFRIVIGLDKYFIQVDGSQRGEQFLSKSSDNFLKLSRRLLENGLFVPIWVQPLDNIKARWTQDWINRVYACCEAKYQQELMNGKLHSLKILKDWLKQMPIKSSEMSSIGETVRKGVWMVSSWLQEQKKQYLQGKSMLQFLVAYKQLQQAIFNNVKIYANVLDIQNYPTSRSQLLFQRLTLLTQDCLAAEAAFQLCSEIEGRPSCRQEWKSDFKKWKSLQQEAQSQRLKQFEELLRKHESY